jgi:hypothetical protein
MHERKKRAMTHEKASKVKTSGHADEEIFATLIGGFVIKGTNKKDVIDKNHNLHSVKSGEKKWQIFLYSKSRFENSIGFFGAKKFIDLLNSIPESFKEYTDNKTISKRNLAKEMLKLKDFLDSENDFFVQNNKIIFLHEAIFHGNEVNYFTIKNDGQFHIFDSMEVLNLIDKNTFLTTSKSRREEETDDQKVLFKIKSLELTLAEIEIRTDSENKYKSVLFNMYKKRLMFLLDSQITEKKTINSDLVIRGRAIKKFKI